jgi:hypothetical protein
MFEYCSRLSVASEPWSKHSHCLREQEVVREGHHHAGNLRSSRIMAMRKKTAVADANNVYTSIYSQESNINKLHTHIYTKDVMMKNEKYQRKMKSNIMSS